MPKMPELPVDAAGHRLHFPVPVQLTSAQVDSIVRLIDSYAPRASGSDRITLRHAKVRLVDAINTHYPERRAS